MPARPISLATLNSLEDANLSFNRGYEALEALVSAANGQIDSDLERNEAQTRFDIIDQVVKEVLGWPSDKIRVERQAGSGFTDYEL
ncbi:hypothetical protein ACFWEJ_07145, partial [Promicromonospora sp. NPDC060204]|uniref:hypothetical protein n=1 Tax=Promicromonospora sp. NPDC060204 TaxID=3347071 RepID=UPI003660EE97